MINKIINAFLVILMTGIFYLAFKGFEEEKNQPVVYNLPEVNPGKVVFPKWKNEELAYRNSNPRIRIPRVGRDFVGFKEALAFNESGRRYDIVNRLGFLGKYQFGQATLRALKLHVSRREFLKNPEIQEEAFKRYVAENRKILAREIRQYSGKYINGVKITESGILAAAHLAGPWAVKKFLRSGGKHSSTDAFGTRIEDYLRKFAGYQLENRD